jgi:hypothetical protein
MICVQCRGCGRSLRLTDDDPEFVGRCAGCGEPFRLGDLLNSPSNSTAGRPAVEEARPATHPMIAVPNGVAPSAARPPEQATATGDRRTSVLAWCIFGGGLLVLLGSLALALILGIYLLSRKPDASVAGQSSGQGEPAVKRPPPANWIGLLAYWPFEEGDGVRAADASGNGQHATLVKARWTDGVRGKALHLDGEGSYLDYSESPRLSFGQGEPFTLAFWLRSRRPKATLLSQRHSRDGGAVIDITIKDGRVHVQVRQDGNDFLGPVELDGPALDDGNWHHLALTRAEDRVELFLDGHSQGQKSGDSARGAITTNLRALGSERYWIEHNSRFFGDPHFEGDLDEFCAFQRVLKADEIKTLAER